MGWILVTKAAWKDGHIIARNMVDFRKNMETWLQTVQPRKDLI
jgi:hypothetical protein